ncbi:MAG: hypothetical protein ACKPKO_13630, partial [Candidatus Fonsibacter sp.]
MLPNHGISLHNIFRESSRNQYIVYSNNRALTHDHAQKYTWGDRNIHYGWLRPRMHSRFKGVRVGDVLLVSATQKATQPTKSCMYLHCSVWFCKLPHLPGLQSVPSVALGAQSVCSYRGCWFAAVG